MPASLLRLHLPVAVLGVLPAVLATKFGGYHMRHVGWVFLGLAIWACVQAARGRLSAPRSVAGVATFAFLALIAWTTASIGWALASTHEAWIESVRTAGYAAVFILGGSLIAGARAYVRFMWIAGGSIAAVGVWSCVRLLGENPMVSFVVGRLDWPTGYVPGTAALYLMGMFVLLGCAVAAERAWAEARLTSRLVASGAALAGAGLCAGLALLAQSRGTIPAVLVAVVAVLVTTPTRLPWLLRFAAIGLVLVAARGTLGDVFQAQFAWRQAPFTPGADQAAALATAEEAARSAGTLLLVLSVLFLLGGVLLAMGSSALGARIVQREQRTGRRVLVPVTITVVTLVIAGGLVAKPGGESIPSRIQEQLATCIDPPNATNDPGSATSYFANTGTGRCDYYRVGLIEVRDRPLLGSGAGNFRAVYVRERRTGEEPLVVHSLPLQWLGELGLVGGALGATILGCVLVGMWRYARSGPRRDPAFVGSIGVIAYWMTHASIDWMWQLPAVTLLPLALAGGLVALVSPGQQRVRSSVAGPIAAGVALAAIALIVPITMADSALRKARDPQLRKSDPEAALQAALDARSYDPSWAEPSITEGVLHFAAGNRELAAAAGKRAVLAEPDSWSVQYRASGLIALADSVAGRDAFIAARRLNPRLPADVSEPEDAPPAQSPKGTTPVDPDSMQVPDRAS